MILGIDTATAATSVALLARGGETFEARDDPPANAHPGHATRLLALADGLFAQAGAGWEDVDLVAVGTGPGGFTGLRIGAATARGIACSLAIDVAGVSSLAALADEAFEQGEWRSALAVIDARRGEVFTAFFSRGEDGLPVAAAAPRAAAPDTVPAPPPGTVVVGDGAVRYADVLDLTGADLLDADSPLHRVRAAAICRLAAAGKGVGAMPEYVRAPDAELKAAAR